MMTMMMTMMEGLWFCWWTFVFLFFTGPNLSAAAERTTIKSISEVQS